MFRQQAEETASDRASRYGVDQLAAIENRHSDGIQGVHSRGLPQGGLAYLPVAHESRPRREGQQIREERLHGHHRWTQPGWMASPNMHSDLQEPQVSPYRTAKYCVMLC